LWLEGAFAAIVLLAPHTLFAEALGFHPDRVLMLLHHSGYGHTVHWTADTHEDGGTFLLYRGNRLDQLEFTLSTTAVRGVEKYSVSDDAPDTTLFYYQLRYVRHSGHVAVLTTVAVVQQQLDRDFPGVELPTTNGKALVRLEWQGPGLSEFAHTPNEGGLPWVMAPSPEVPPPRAG
jgi:hypothetical protein